MAQPYSTLVESSADIKRELFMENEAHIVALEQKLAQCMASCLECAERAHQHRLDCEAMCRACAEQCLLALRYLALRNPTSELMLHWTEKACRECSATCRPNKSMGHCQRCAEGCEQVVKSITEQL